MDFPKLMAQKHVVKVAELSNLIASFNSVQGKDNQIIHMHKCNLTLAEIPDVLFSNYRLLFTTIWRIVENTKLLTADPNHNKLHLLKLADILDLLQKEYKLSEQECGAICNVYSLPKNTATEKFISDARIAHIGNYLRKILLPYWQDLLSPECVEYVTDEIEKNIKDTNEFIAKEDLLNTVYFVDPKPENWRAQLTYAGIPFDDYDN